MAVFNLVAQCLTIGLAKKVFIFFLSGSSSAQLSLTSFKTILLLYCDSCHISMHLKKTYQIGEFLFSHFNIEDGRRYATFSAYLYYFQFKKGKTATETQKKTCAVYGEGAVTD